MRELNSADDISLVCKALGSPVRMQIVQQLSEWKSANLNTLADALGITNGAMTAHIKQLQEAGIIEVFNTAGKRGLQKECTLRELKYLINISNEYPPDKSYLVDLPVGSYTKHDIHPTCGLSSPTALIGIEDDKRYFDDPLRSTASILWFTRGFVEYRIPNYLEPDAKPQELQISLELSSEAPGFCDDWPSDIHFHLNGVLLGFWTSPGDFGAKRGFYTPDWWFDNWNQYGLLKLLSIDGSGTYMDGFKISGVTLGDLKINHESTMDLRISVPDTAINVGGATIYGEGFGNYNQNIRVRMIFD